MAGLDHGAEDAMIEQWRAMVDFEGYYEVSDLGRVRSVHRVIIRSNGVLQTVRPRILRQGLAGIPRKYLKVNTSRDGVIKTSRVAVEVVKAFHGPNPGGMEVRHLNGDSTDNRAANLQWGTHSENILDAVRHGTHPLLKASRERRAETRRQQAT